MVASRTRSTHSGPHIAEVERNGASIISLALEVALDTFSIDVPRCSCRLRVGTQAVQNAPEQRSWSTGDTDVVAAGRRWRGGLTVRDIGQLLQCRISAAQQLINA